MPLGIDHASYEYPALSIYGKNWSLNTDSSWRLVKGGVVFLGVSETQGPEALTFLEGESIIGVRPQSELVRGDPAFELTGGMWLEIFSDQGVDPWVFSLPQIVFVGSPYDPEQVG
ncbi:hypothetical protein ABIB25_003856 [Nakamurella sp. UYEF19]|uniref:hypothetical protein n=1 Tax=Nakamurella sp. UYEF19 TaxID=1756392 RepID=UPI00339867B0